LIESRATQQFWRLFSSLPEEVQQEAKRAYRHFRTNPTYPSLHFKKLEGHDDIYSVRIGLGYRALAVMKGNRVVWYWIGGHAEYDPLV
jgi:hypothetical protein